MTTNKQEVKRYELESGHDSMMRRVNRMQEFDGGVYVRFDDYEALHAERDKLLEEVLRLRVAMAKAAQRPRYDHVCRECKIEFSNIVKDCDLCCVCEVREIRREWDR